jgi:hypothetical protein
MAQGATRLASSDIDQYDCFFVAREATHNRLACRKPVYRVQPCAFLHVRSTQHTGPSFGFFELPSLHKSVEVLDDIGSRKPIRVRLHICVVAILERACKVVIRRAIAVIIEKAW